MRLATTCCTANSSVLKAEAKRETHAKICEGRVFDPFQPSKFETNVLFIKKFSVRSMSRSQNSAPEHSYVEVQT